MIKGIPVEFTQDEVLTIAVFLQQRVTNILKTANKIYVSEKSEILPHAHNAVKYSYDFNEYYYLYGNVYLVGELLGPNSKKRVLAISFLLLNEDFTSLDSVLSNLEQFLEICKNIRRITENANEERVALFNRAKAYIGYKKWDMVAFTKAAKKYGAKVSISDGHICLTFKNIRTGNDMEGFIQYKSIQCFLENSDKIPKRFIFTFNKFFWDSDWEASVSIGHFHPHIQNGSLCLGNRKSDYNMYVLSHSYSFMIELLRESLTNYCPDGPPFSPISAIRNKLSVLNKLIDVKLNKDGKKSLKEVNDPRAWLREIKKENRCSRCGNMRVGNICTGRCRANPTFVINCARCNTPLTVGEWDAESHTYTRYCQQCQGSQDRASAVYFCPHCRTRLGASNDCVNSDCDAYQMILFFSDGRFVSTAPLPLCSECEQELVFEYGNGFVCRNNTCEFNGIYFYDENGRPTS